MFKISFRKYYFSSGSHFVQWSRTVCAALVEGNKYRLFEDQGVPLGHIGTGVAISA